MPEWQNGKPADQKYPLFYPAPAPAPRPQVDGRYIPPCGNGNCMLQACKNGCQEVRRSAWDR